MFTVTKIKVTRAVNQDKSTGVREMFPAILHKQDTSFKSCCWTRLNVSVASSTTEILTFWHENAKCFFLSLTLWSVAAKVFVQKVIDSFYPGSKHIWKPGFIPRSFSIWNSCFVSSQGREKQALPEGASVTLRFNLSLISPGFPDMSPHDCGPKLCAVSWMLELSRMNAQHTGGNQSWGSLAERVA